MEIFEDFIKWLDKDDNKEQGFNPEKEVKYRIHSQKMCEELGIKGKVMKTSVIGNIIEIVVQQ